VLFNRDNLWAYSMCSWIRIRHLLMTFDAVYTNNNCTSIYLLHELSAEKKFVITENCTSLKLWVLHLRKYERCFSLLCKYVVNILRNCHVVIPCRGGSRMGAIAPQKPMKVTLFTMVLQIGKQHSRYKAILSSTVLSQHCWSILHPSYSSEDIIQLDYQILLKSPLS